MSGWKRYDSERWKYKEPGSYDHVEVETIQLNVPGPAGNKHRVSFVFYRPDETRRDLLHNQSIAEVHEYSERIFAELKASRR